MFPTAGMVNAENPVKLAALVALVVIGTGLLSSLYFLVFCVGAEAGGVTTSGGGIGNTVAGVIKKAALLLGAGFTLVASTKTAASGAPGAKFKSRTWVVLGVVVGNDGKLEPSLIPINLKLVDPVVTPNLPIKK